MAATLIALVTMLLTLGCGWLGLYLFDQAMLGIFTGVALSAALVFGVVQAPRLFKYDRGRPWPHRPGPESSEGSSERR